MTEQRGLTDNIEELQQYIELLEEELDKRGESNLTDTTADRVVNTPPGVSGLELVSNLNTVTVRWDPIGVGNLDFYEVQVASNPSFALADSATQRNTQFTYQEGDPDTTYYVRVRAKAINGGYGPWSGTLDTATGLATFSHLVRGSATSLTDNVIDLSTESILDPYYDVSHNADHDVPGAMGTEPTGTLNTLTGTYGNTVISATGGTVLPFTYFEYSAAYTWAHSSSDVVYVTIDLKRNDVIIDTITIDAFSSVGHYDITVGGATPPHELARTPVVGLGTPDEPGVGVFTYSITLTVAQNNGGAASIAAGYIAVQPQKINIELVELRN